MVTKVRGTVANEYKDYTKLRAASSAKLIDGDRLMVAGFPDAWEVKTGTVTDSGWYLVFNDDSNRYAESTSEILAFELFDGDANAAWAAMVAQSRITHKAMRAPIADTVITQGTTADHFFVLYGLRECGSIKWQPSSDNDKLIDTAYSAGTTPSWSLSTENTLIGPIIRDVYVRGDRNRPMGCFKFTQCDKHFLENLRLTGIKGHSIEMDSCREWTMDSVITRFCGDRVNKKADIRLHSDLPPSENTNFAHIRGCFSIYSLWDGLEMDDVDAMSISGGLMLHGIPLSGETSVKIFYNGYYGNQTDIDDWYGTFYDVGGADEASLLQLSGNSTVQADHIKCYAGGKVPVNISGGRFTCSNILLNGSDRVNGADFCLRATDSAKVQIGATFYNNTQQLFEEVSGAEVSINNVIEGGSIGAAQAQSGSLEEISYGSQVWRGKQFTWSAEDGNGNRRTMNTVGSGNNVRLNFGSGFVNTVGGEPFNAAYEVGDIWSQNDAMRTHTANGTKYIPLKASVPASATSAGRIGDIAWDSNFIYVYTGNGTTHSWVRAAAASW